MLNELGIAVPENSSTQTNQSEFDITSMLGEWTLELILPDGSTVRRVIHSFSNPVFILFLEKLVQT